LIAGGIDPGKEFVEDSGFTVCDDTRRGAVTEVIDGVLPCPIALEVSEVFEAKLSRLEDWLVGLV
jgi:hypothetical protein